MLGEAQVPRTTSTHRSGSDEISLRMQRAYIIRVSRKRPQKERICLHLEVLRRARFDRLLDMRQCPDSQTGIATAGDDEGARWHLFAGDGVALWENELQAPHSGAVAEEDERASAGAKIPYAHGSICGARNEDVFVVLQSPYPTFVADETSRETACVDVVHLDTVIRLYSRNDLGTIELPVRSDKLYQRGTPCNFAVAHEVLTSTSLRSHLDPGRTCA